MPERILIVDDEEGIRVFLAEAVKRMGYAVEEASTAEEAVDKFRQRPFDLTIMDVMLPGADGIEAGYRLKELDAHAVIIVITANGSKDVAFRAIAGGAYDFFTKPIHLEDFTVIVKRGLERRRWLLAQTAEEAQPDFPELLGASAAIQEVRKVLRRVVPTDVTVLILGETGTGKELVAQTIHQHSPRRDHPFIAINCAAIPEGLLESELFGHEKGAFTGAVSRKPGKFELAHTGTIFLDEVGDMSLAAQAKTLRLIEEQILRRVGGSDTKKVDVRVIAATNKNLAEAIRRNQFRSDLFFRLNVFPIQLPPLRERDEDILPLAMHCLAQNRARVQHPILGISPEAQQLLRTYHWPGNVRELKSCMEWAAVMAENGLVDKNSLPPAVLEPAESRLAMAPSTSLRAAVNQVEKDLVITALKACGGQQVEAARQLGVSERTVWYLVKKHGIDVRSLE